MRVELKRLHRQLDATIVYVTHDQVEALTLADRILVLNSGVVQQIGTPTDLFDHPANRFVAGFIGSPSMNFLKGEGDGESIHVGPIRVPSSHLGPVSLGVRPNEVHIDPQGAPATIDVIEHLGWELHLHLRLEDGQELTARVETSVLPDAQAGQVLRVALGTVHLFDVESGQRLEV